MGQSDSKLAHYREHVFRLADLVPTPLYSPCVSSQEVIKYYNDPNSWSRKDFPDPFSAYFNEFVVPGAEARDVYSVISSQELRFICNSNMANFTAFIRFAAFKIHVLSCLLQNCDSVATFKLRESQLLTFVRILTKIIPVFYEMDVDQKHENSIFWNQNSSEVLHCEGLISEEHATLNVNHVITEAQDLVPLGVLIVQACVKLLFIKGFTVPLTRQAPRDYGKTSFLLWEDGINTTETNYAPPSPTLDAKRLEILRLLLTLSSKQLYSQHMPKFLVVLTTSVPEFHSICLTSSIINLVCRSCRSNDDNNGLQYPSNSYHSSSKSSQLTSMRKSLTMTGLQLLNLSMLCPLEREHELEIQTFLYGLNLYSTNFKINNLVLTYLSTLSREFDLKFILVNLATLLKRPMEQAIEIESNPFYLLGNSAGGSNNGKRASQSKSNAPKGFTQPNSVAHLPRSTLQIVVLLWELMKCNKSFENYVADKYANKLILVCIYYIKNYSKSSEWRTDLIPIVSGFATYLSSKKLVLSKMQYCFNANYYANKIPDSYKISVGDASRLTFRDFAIIHLTNLVSLQVNANTVMNASLIEIIFNLLCVPGGSQHEDLVQLSSDKSNKVTGLSYNTSVAFLRLMARMTSKEFLKSFAEDAKNGIPETSNEGLEVSKQQRVTKGYVLSPGFKLDLLALLIQAFNSCVLNHFKDSKHLLFVFCRHENVIKQLQKNLVEISSELSYDCNKYEPRGADKEVVSHVDDYFDDSLPTDIRYNWQIDRRHSNNHEDYDMIEKAQFQSLLIFEPDQQKLEEVEHAAEKVAQGSPNKTIELYEYADDEHDPVLESTDLLLALRPHRPFGLTFRNKLKSRKDASLHNSWLGAGPLSLMTKIIRLVTQEFPAILQVTGDNYVQQLRLIIKFEPYLKEQVRNSMSPQTRRLGNECETLIVNWDSNETAFNWYLSSLWKDAFNYNSVPFISTFTKESTQQDAGQQSHSQSFSQPQTPKLERWNSQGSSLSRTNSNNSLITNYLLQQEPDSASNSAPNSPVVSSGFSSWVNNKPHSGGQTSERSSLFRFSWTGFQKANTTKIDEESETETQSAANHQGGSFILDPGLLKPNIWVGTKVTLFGVKVGEREKYSLVDMTSNFLRKLRFGSNTNLNAPEGIMVTSGTLTPATSRPWTPRGSLAARQSL
ncbi:LAME_0E08526g1_1 [Lachancea meyersii CBS 8951]|uniref:LAME_0E08526g1_1 n=1 Tax=Lachancea meyersii CBS 8951 TaxID=1266667 RepID=A0A1G4JIX6_9SACH|nr:LAME_0E08526g1_1 [Lachancea meyersii CBS 8951]